MMMLTAVTALAVVVVAAATPTAVHPNVKLDEPLEQDAIIDAVNNAKTTWVAGRNFKSSLTKRYLKNLLGVLMDFDDVEERLAKPVIDTKDVVELDDSEDFYAGKLPKEFDARTYFSYCSVIKEVRDQGPCGSCWAVSVVSTATDRLCIATKGRFNMHLSTQDLLSCCCCCSAECGQGCKGGYPNRAWSFLYDVGIVTGGDFHSKEGCQPYSLPPCEHHVPGPRKDCSKFNETSPHCSLECYNKQYKNQTYAQDKHKVKNAVILIGASPKRIMKEIITNGPVQAIMVVFEDFCSYKSGVYQHVSGDRLGGHAVKIIGWGEENGTPYWLVANSWNSDWGDSGFFKILRGKNECYIEEEMGFGKPDVDGYYV